MSRRKKKRASRFGFVLSELAKKYGLDADSVPYSFRRGVDWSEDGRGIVLTRSAASRLTEGLADRQKVEVLDGKPIEEVPLEVIKMHRGGVPGCDNTFPTFEVESLYNVGNANALVRVEVEEETEVRTENIEFQDNQTYVKGSAPTVLTVTSLPLNPRLALCGDKHVLVGRQETLWVGARLKAIPDPANPGYWTLAGPLPRWKGDKIGLL